jgi:7-cyano-7-deazaguanine synthase in queuosine biosynthesis
MKAINIGNFKIDIHEGPIGVCVSGGADSAVLLYILMKHALGPIHVITSSIKSKNRTHPHVVLRLIDKLFDLTNNKNVQHHTFFVDRLSKDNLTAGVASISQSLNLNVTYLGLTSVPPDSVRQMFNSEEVTSILDHRGPEKNHSTYLYDNRVYFPMINLDKKEIKTLYEELGILEELFPLTRSCEDKTLTIGHCGKCWWCEERRWGFGRLE